MSPYPSVVMVTVEKYINARFGPSDDREQAESKDVSNVDVWKEMELGEHRCDENHRQQRRNQPRVMPREVQPQKVKGPGGMTGRMGGAEFMIVETVSLYRLDWCLGNMMRL